MITTYIIVAVVAYLLGSIPFGYILVRVFTGADVRSQGSGNIGATNVARTGKKGLAIATLLLDALKGFVAVLLASARAPYAAGPVVYTPFATGPQAAIDPALLQELSFRFGALAALFAILGHMFPVWL